MGRKAKYAPKIGRPDAEEMRQCDTCAKNALNDRSCTVFTDRPGQNGPCSAWTNDPNWESEIERITKEYAAKRKR
jgi:hypothetical protein